MGFGISQLESTINGVASASQSLREDSRFLPFFYWEPNYSTITSPTRNHMKAYLDSLMFPLTLVSDWSLQFNDHYAITTYRFISTEDAVGYYPESFHVGDLSYSEWEELLTQNKSGFLPIQQISLRNSTYDALIYSVPWVNDSFLFVCINIEDVKQALIDDSNLDDFCLTIEQSDGSCLYTDLTTENTDFYSVTQKTSVGNLVITVHVPNEVLTSRMGPLYLFLGIYLVVCIIVLIAFAYFLTHLSSKPLLEIVNILDKSHTGRIFSASEQQEKSSQIQFGFKYIEHKLHSYENGLNAYRSTVETQAKILQARFMEKALHGSLVTDKDYESFLSYFPDFPERFCLVLFRLSESPFDDGNIFTDPLSLVQSFLQEVMSNVYQQQLSDSELLLIISEDHFNEDSDQINKVIANINREEPCYHAWGIVSKFYTHPKHLPSAYTQILDLNDRISPNSFSALCMVADHQVCKKAGFQMEDTRLIYSAITYGNKEVALLKLQNYSDSLQSKNRSVFEMFRSILLCIKQEYANQLIDVDIPYYHTQHDLYDALKNTISAVCDELQSLRKATVSNPFVLEVKEYIDLHFTEDDLGYTKLADHFNCSPSKIQKAFASELDITIASYIEKKRMELANELLEQGKDTVAEIALKCGFTSKNTFHKAYVRVFGHTPKSLK